MSDTIKDKSKVSVTDEDSTFRQLLSDFLSSEHHIFIVQKAEKLASALYMVTGFVPDADPLRTRLRLCAVELISTSADPVKARDVRYHEGFASRCLEIASILKLAERAGFISHMNAQLLCDEYAGLAAFVKEHHDKIFNGGVVADTGDERGHSGAFGALSPARGLKDTATSRTDTKIHQSKRHDARKDIIIRLLDKKDKISVKDACDAVGGCSGKTIQRLLMSLVDEGILLREGQRRWSVYKKVTQI